MTQPSAYEQYMLELVNRTRLDPDGEVERFNATIDTYNEVYSSPRSQMVSVTDGGADVTSNPLQPLAFNSLLIKSSRAHTNWMLDADMFSHTEDGTGLGVYLQDRLDAVNYNYSTAGENIARSSIGASIPQHVLWAHEGLFYSVGHRNNILEGDYREIGLGIAQGDFKGTNNIAVTQNFGASGSSVFLTGVAFDDLSTDDNFYTIGEGLRGISIEAVRQGDHKSFTTTTMDAGGYQIALDAGTYDIRFSLNGTTLGSAGNVTIDSENIKVDLNTDDLLDATDFDTSSLITGTNSADDLLGGNTSQYIKGQSGNDIVYGDAGNDTLDGGNGRDIVIGGKGDDFVLGGNENDLLVGVNPVKDNPGYGELDRLRGGAGEDIFALGDASGVYYDHGGTLTEGKTDRASILDFNLSEDTILLHGSTSNYRLAQTSSATNIYYKAASGLELIGTVNHVFGLNLSSSKFAFASNNFSIGGTSGNNKLYGGDTNQEFRGGDGNDTLIGGGGNDLLLGGNGNDVLIGVSIIETNPGYNQLDRLRGDAGVDVFVLGDSDRSYYNHDTTQAAGRADRASILDFNLSQDIIQLHGSASDYQLKAAASGTEILYTANNSGLDELIGFVNGASGLDLSSSEFNYV
jgi:serralysin